MKRVTIRSQMQQQHNHKLRKRLLLVCVLASCFFIPIVLLVLFMCCFVLEAMPFSGWKRNTINQVRSVVADYEGRTVAEIVEWFYTNGEYSTPPIWSLHSDFPLFDAKVECCIQSRDGSDAVLVWQWDRTWPSPRALNKRTAELCPLLHPGIELSEDGTYSQLFHGSGAIESYFSPKDHPVRINHHQDD